MGKIELPLGHHLDQISEAQLVAQVPTHAQDNHLAIKMPTSKQLFDASQPAHRQSSLAKGGEHQALLSIAGRYVMRQAVGLTRGPLGRQSEDRALSNEVRGRVILVQIWEYRSERLARVQLH